MRKSTLSMSAFRSRPTTETEKKPCWRETRLGSQVVLSYTARRIRPHLALDQIRASRGNRQATLVIGRSRAEIDAGVIRVTSHEEAPRCRRWLRGDKGGRIGTIATYRGAILVNIVQFDAHKGRRATERQEAGDSWGGPVIELSAEFLRFRRTPSERVLPRPIPAGDGPAGRTIRRP